MSTTSRASNSTFHGRRKRRHRSHMDRAVKKKQTGEVDHSLKNVRRLHWRVRHMACSAAHARRHASVQRHARQHIVHRPWPFFLQVKREEQREQFHHHKQKAWGRKRRGGQEGERARPKVSHFQKVKRKKEAAPNHKAEIAT
jgi:hypothetical protein